MPEKEGEGEEEEEGEGEGEGEEEEGEGEGEGEREGEGEKEGEGARPSSHGVSLLSSVSPAPCLRASVQDSLHTRTQSASRNAGLGRSLFKIY